MAGSSRDYVVRSVQAWAVVGGTTVEVVKIHLEYSLNAIPTGLITLALGYDAGSQTDSTANALLEKLQTRTPVTVFLSVSGLVSGKTIFEGFSAGVSTDRSTQRAGLVVAIVGWLDDMRATSAFSELFSPTTPGALLSAAGWNILGIVANTPQGAGAIFTEFLLRDIWDGTSKALYAMSQSPAAIAGVSAVSGGGGGLNTALKGNDMGAAALKRFTGALPLGGTDRYLADAVGAQLGQVVFGQAGGPTLWSKLLTMAGLMGFMVAPKIGSAEVIAYQPFVPTSAITKVIPASEYTDIATEDPVQHSIRGVGLLGGQGALTGYFDTVRRSADLGDAWDIMGKYDSGRDGVWEMRQAPLWLSKEGSAAQWTRITTGFSSGGIPGNGPKRPPRGGSMTQEENASRDQRLADRLAHTFWLQLVFAERRAQARGILRLDVCPGSNIKIEVPGSDVAGVQGRSVYASVDKVALDISAQESTAMTTFHVSSVRGEGDNNLANGTHPLYGTAFVSGTL